MGDATAAHSETDFGTNISLTAPGIANIALGTSATSLKFISMSKINLTAGSATSTVVADGGANVFTAGKAALMVTGGAGADSYVYHTGNALLTISDFSAGKGDSITFDKSLQSVMKTASDGHGGTAVSFGTMSAGVDLTSVTAAPTSVFHWV